MGLNMKELPPGRASESQAAIADQRSITKDFVRQWNARQVEYRAATLPASIKGKRVSRAELFAYLEDELAKGTRSRLAIARDAAISVQALANYIKKGQVKLFNAAKPFSNGCCPPEQAL